MKSPRYSIEVYKDYAIIRGLITSEILMVLVRLCKKEGFTHMTHNDNEPGFKLVRKIEKERNTIHS